LVGGGEYELAISIYVFGAEAVMEQKCAAERRGDRREREPGRRRGGRGWRRLWREVRRWK
jgi:hypothetical protein